MRVHVVHGILDPVGASGLLRLVPYLRDAGFDVRVPDYGLITAGETRIVNPLIFRTMKPYFEPGDIYVGHSNGCAIGYDLVLDGARPSGMVLIDAALRRDIVLPDGTWADVYHNSGDDATLFAAVGERLGVVDRVWGEMGHAGYDGTNPLIVNIDCGRPPPSPTSGVVLPRVCGHSDIFSVGKIELWAPYIVARIVARQRAGQS